ncbi:hypothetical protein [Glaciibacter sp. 2TAF33]|uniref:hypothetical protein n=1 Tax=Glaciibacter sp. 2TAF33 TaxID=3233015 RepID=UPI003F8EB2B3
MTGRAGSSGDPPPGPLIVSGGGGALVATDHLLAQAAMLRLLHREATGWQERLLRIRSLEFEAVPTWAGGRAAGIYGAAQAVDAVEADSRELADSLTSAAEDYGRAERLAEMLARYSGAGAAYLLGRILPLLAAVAIPTLAGGALAWLLGSALTGTDPAEAPARLAELLRRNPRLLTNPVLVRMVRVMASSIDDAAAGAAGVPLPVSFPLGDEGLGVLGVGTSAAGALAMARPFGLLRETAVTAKRSGAPGTPTMAGPPAGLADLAVRIPPASRASPQVRIERYGSAASPAWVVYVGGTVEWDPRASTEPWDLGSNLAAIADATSGGHPRADESADAGADGRAGSYRAVVQAMREAGVGPADPVVQVGHSQGGLVAAEVATSAGFNTVAVATFGAPNGQVPVPAAVPMIRVEHTDDLVPALGGAARDATAAGSKHLLVRREVFAGREVPVAPDVPAHSLSNYRETGRLIDGSAEPRLVEFRARLDALLGSEPGEVTMWRAVRVAPGAG